MARGMGIAIAGVLIASVLTTGAAAQEGGGRELTAADVNESIQQGVDFLKRQQHKEEGHWTDYDGQPGGLTALCTLAMLNCGLTSEDPAVAKALRWLEAQPPPNTTYSTSLRIMVFVVADPKAYKASIESLAKWLEAHQLKDGETKGGWSYTDRPGRADNSNTQFAMLGLHEAERAGVKISDRTWQLALNYWTTGGMQKIDGSWGYENGFPATGSMTCAGIASVIIAQDRLHTGDASVVDGRLQCCTPQPEASEVERGIQWLSDHFAVTINPTTQGARGGVASGNWLFYYLYGVERVGRMSGRRYFIRTDRNGNRVAHDWYREGAAQLLAAQDSLDHAWRGVILEKDPLIATSLALLFLAKGKRPVVIGKLRHSSDVLGGGTDWDHHRRAVQNLTSRIERQWKRDLSWQTIDVAGASLPDLLETPVLFISGSTGLNLTAEQKTNLKQYVEQGGFLFVEACDGNGCDGTQFDVDFRALVKELFPDSQLRKLPPDHAVWFAQEPVNPQHLPKDPEFWLWGLDSCCRTSIVYCPRSLSCRWELSQPYRETNYPDELKNEIEACVRIGANVVAYATNRELKEKLDRPQITISETGGKADRGALVIPKLSHGGGSDDAPNALNNLLTVLEKQLEMRVDYQRRLIAPDDPKLYDYPILFAHGRRSFSFSQKQRQALKEYLERGGFLFADAICASPQFAEALKSELRAMYPEARWARVPPNHPMFSDEFHGFSLRQVTLRDPQSRDENDPLTARLVKTTPLLEALEIDGRIAVILSPYDISCALEKGTSLECKGYIPADAARLAANVILYALQQE